LTLSEVLAGSAVESVRKNSAVILSASEAAHGVYRRTTQPGWEVISDCSTIFIIELLPDPQGPTNP
jgi:hypothetical protein